MKTINLTILALLLTSLSFSGCFIPQDQDDEFDPPPPPAAAQFIHQNPEMGSIEVLFNDSLITSVSYGRMSPAVTLPQGEGAFSFRQAGAPSAFHTTLLYTLEDRVYTFALVDSSFSSDNSDNSDKKVLDLSESAPEPAEDQHWLRFLNLSDLEAGNLFRGDDPIMSLPLDENPSPFIAVEAASSTNIGLNSETNAPIKIAEGIQLPSGGSSILMLSGSRENNSIEIKTIPLDIDRLSLIEPGAEADMQE